MCIYQAACRVFRMFRTREQMNNTLGSSTCQLPTRPRVCLHDSSFFVRKRARRERGRLPRMEVSPREPQLIAARLAHLYIVAIPEPSGRGNSGRERAAVRPFFIVRLHQRRARGAEESRREVRPARAPQHVERRAPIPCG